MDAVGHYFVGCILVIALLLAGIAAVATVAALWVRWDVDSSYREIRPPWTPSILLIGAAVVLFVLCQTVAKFWGWPQ